MSLVGTFYEDEIGNTIDTTIASLPSSSPVVDDGSTAESPATTPQYNIRHITLSYLPHISGALSILGSAYIICDILLKRRLQKEAKRRTYHRLILGLSITDLIASIGMFCSTWPIPIDSPSNEYKARGSLATCNTQGFFIQLGSVSTPIYNAFLSVYYLLVVKYGWKQEHFTQTTKLEKFYFHSIPWLVGIVTSITSLLMDHFNSANLWCWIAPTPLDCIDSLRSEDGTTTCIRGDNAWLYRLLFYFIWLWLSVLCVMICTFGVLHTVITQIRKLKNNDTTANRHITNVAKQSLFYVGAFFLTALFPSMVRMLQAKWNCTTTHFPLSLMTATFMPLQGLWNFLIYIQPRYKSWLKKQKKLKLSAEEARKNRNKKYKNNSGSATSGTSRTGGSARGSTTTSLSSPRLTFIGRWFTSNRDEEEEKEDLIACSKKAGSDMFNTNSYRNSSGDICIGATTKEEITSSADKDDPRSSSSSSLLSPDTKVDTKTIVDEEKIKGCHVMVDDYDDDPDNNSHDGEIPIIES